MSRWTWGRRPGLDELLDLGTPRPEDDLQPRRGYSAADRAAAGLGFGEAVERDPEAERHAADQEHRERCPWCRIDDGLPPFPGAVPISEAPPFVRELLGAIDRAIAEPDAEPGAHRYTAVLSVTRDDGKAVVDITATGPYALAREVIEGALSSAVDEL